MNLPSQMSPAAMGGDVISGQGTPTVFASFDTTKYGSPGPFPLQSPALTDPSASMFKFYVEAEAGAYLFRDWEGFCLMKAQAQLSKPSYTEIP